MYHDKETARQLEDLIVNDNDLYTFEVAPWGQKIEISLIDARGATYLPRAGYVVVAPVGGDLQYLGFNPFDDAETMFRMLAQSHARTLPKTLRNPA